MRKTFSKLVATALMTAACVSIANAQLNPPVATSVLRPAIIIQQPPCGVLMTVTFTSPTLGNATFSASGTAQFQTASISADGQPAGNTQTINALNATATTDQFGTITWSLANVANTTPTSIQANQVSRDFPATSNIYFTPEATISSQPGVTYRPHSEVHLQTTNLQSFGPQRSEAYTAASAITFYNTATDEEAFTISLSGISVAAVPDAQVLRPYIGSRPTCPAKWRTRFTSATLGSYSFDASATATFETQTVTADADAAGNTQRPISISASATVDRLGTINWTLNAADATPTAITANQAGTNFPATSDIYFTPEATISSQPGVRYVATREVHLQTTNLRSFNPQVNESYTVVGGTIDFADAATNEVAFSIDLSNFVVGGDNAVATPPGGNGNGDGNLLSQRR